MPDGEVYASDGVGIGKILKWVAIGIGVIIILRMCVNC